MGIYPTYQEFNKQNLPHGGQMWEQERQKPGVTYARTVVATPWVETGRTDCFHCTCGDREGSDVACRNHGFDGRRPCEKHNLPGEPDETGEMPLSVEKVREADARLPSG